MLVCWLAHDEKRWPGPVLTRGTRTGAGEPSRKPQSGQTTPPPAHAGGCSAWPPPAGTQESGVAVGPWTPTRPGNNHLHCWPEQEKRERREGEPPCCHASVAWHGCPPAMPHAPAARTSYAWTGHGGARQEIAWSAAGSPAEPPALGSGGD